MRFRLLLSSIMLAGAFVLTSPASPATAQSPCSSWLRIADISNWNGIPDWPLVAKSGIAAVYIEAGDGNWTNPLYAPDVNGANSVGLPHGAYYFGRPGTTDPTASADLFAQIISNDPGTLPPALDLEVSTIDAASSAAWARTFQYRLTQDTGRVPTLYTGAYYPWSSDSSLSVWPLWLSAYPLGYTPVNSACGLTMPSGGVWGDWSLWQFTSSANLWGLNGNTDLSVAEPAWWETYTGASTAPPGSAGNRYPQPVYGPNSQGPKVVWIQRILHKAGLFNGKWDGIIGPETEAAISTWQSKLGLIPDGHWGPVTERATQNLLALVKALHVKRPKAPQVLGNHGIQVYRLTHSLHVLGSGVPVSKHYNSKVARYVKGFKRGCNLHSSGQRFGKPALRCLDNRLKGKGR